MKSTILTILTLSVGLQLTAATTNTVSKGTNSPAGSKTNLTKRTPSGIPVYKVVITNASDPIPVTNAVVSWTLDPNAKPVPIADLPGYRPPVAWYEAPPQDPPAVPSAPSAQTQNGDARVAFGYAQWYESGRASFGYSPYYPVPGVVVGFGVGVRYPHHHPHHRRR